MRVAWRDFAPMAQRIVHRGHLRDKWAWAAMLGEGFHEQHLDLFLEPHLSFGLLVASTIDRMHSTVRCPILVAIPRRGFRAETLGA
jgi:hypothetical protein